MVSVSTSALTILYILSNKSIGAMTLSPSLLRVTYNRALPPGMAMRARNTPTRNSHLNHRRGRQVY
jgi:hypothetical protein